MNKEIFSFPWILAIRPKTLGIATMPVLIGTLLAARVATVDWLIAFFAWMCALMIQIATNLINDLIDCKKGADNKMRLGPVRVVQMGLISPQQIFVGIICSLLLALIFGIPLIAKGGTPIAILLGAAILLAYLYTGGPRPLAYYGLGEFFVLLFFGWIATGAATYLQTAQIDLASLIAGSQTGLFAVAILAINNLRDVESDSRAGKHTLAVVMGTSFGRVEIAVSALLPFVFGIYWLMQGNFFAALLPLVTLPLAIKVIYGVWTTEPSAVYNRFFALAGLLHLLFGCLLAVGCL